MQELHCDNCWKTFSFRYLDEDGQETNDIQNGVDAMQIIDGDDIYDVAVGEPAYCPKCGRALKTEKLPRDN